MNRQPEENSFLPWANLQVKGPQAECIVQYGHCIPEMRCRRCGRFIPSKEVEKMAFVIENNEIAWNQAYKNAQKTIRFQKSIILILVCIMIGLILFNLA